MQKRRIARAAALGLLAGTLPAAAQTAEPPPAPPASESSAPPAAETQSQTPPAPAAPAPPAAQSAEPVPQPPPPAAATSVPNQTDSDTTLPEVTVTQKPQVKQVAGPPTADTAIAVAPAPASGTGSGVAAAGAGGGTGTGSNSQSEFQNGVPVAKIPQAVSRINPGQIQAQGVRQVPDALEKFVPGLIITDTAGGGTRPDIQFRGFDASPIGGRSQGLAVYQNGVRINEAFGDTVNLDLIPAIAIRDMTVIGANPIYGLNAIGGAIGITMKDGFSFQGGTIDALGGSFGRGQISMEAGANSGTFGAYAALELMTEEGFRDFSEANYERFYGDLGFKGSAVEVHVNLTAAQSNAGVVAAAPVEVLDVGWNRTFTHPQETDLEVLMPTVNATVQATDTLSFTGIGYFRKFKSKVIDGNLSEVEPCDPLTFSPADGGVELCDDEGEEIIPETTLEQVFGPGFNYGAFVGVGELPIGSIERINQDAESWGGTVMATERARIFGRPNQLTVGLSYDQGKVRYNTSSEIGSIGERFTVTGSGVVVQGPEDFDPDTDESPELAPRVLDTENKYFGAYFVDVLSLTDQLTLTVGGRYNDATIKMTDLTGYLPNLNTTNDYQRFNPMVGATYQFSEMLNMYGSYAEANRAPTPAELGCAEPENPCVIESFLTDDPPLEQVVTKTFEFGFRGQQKGFNGELFTWSAGLFHALNENDILNVAAEQTGRGYFLNAGDTLRQGIELAAAYQTRSWSVYGSYALVDATYDSDIVLPAPNTPNGTETCPDADPLDPEPPQCNFVQSGDTIPGIPRHRFKAGFEYWLTPDWKIGSDLVAASDQFFFGDDANNNRKLPGYTQVDLRTSYKLTQNAEIYGLINNLFDQKYGLYGTFFDTEESEAAALAAGYDELEDARSISPSQPFAIYGGLRLTF
jgi:outer membrane receptor protein involved in Fe transport